LLVVLAVVAVILAVGILTVVILEEDAGREDYDLGLQLLLPAEF
jgi:hypothetical protein